MASASRVSGGLKAAITNPNVSPEAKDRAQERLDHEDFAPHDLHLKNPERVLAGLKGALKNPNVSEEKKEEIHGKIDESGF
ncbi:hypothetical protein CROQUDRAFT_393099 [Cronartium quercuum f. sp. fusiforme G11]|uniref:Conidiation-specific protein 6 n=1 Tax=Cronartium quercuum f. sp. fusiforme G11 TaxID=708437 RepID=A0A9P6NMF0_9BASI|nr:hypothetical protein CROQUDRAFT_393099 [Cronartium quercuum f. sp. fusiforme G11]